MIEANKMRPTVRSVHDLTVLCVHNQAKILNKSDMICELPWGWRCLRNAFSEKCTTRQPHRLIISFFYKRRELFILNKLSKIIVHSNYVKSSLVRNGIDSSKIETIPIGIPRTTNMQGASRPGTILFAGNINRLKGLHCLINALSKVRLNYELVVVGDGPEFEEIKSLGERVLGVQSS